MAAAVPGRCVGHALYRPVGWNSLRIGGAIPDDELLEAVDASYRAVLSKLPKKERPGSAAPDGPG
jgi:hypothetical protein